MCVVYRRAHPLDCVDERQRAVVIVAREHVVREVERGEGAHLLEGCGEEDAGGRDEPILLEAVPQGRRAARANSVGVAVHRAACTRARHRREAGAAVYIEALGVRLCCACAELRRGPRVWPCRGAVLSAACRWHSTRELVHLGQRSRERLEGPFGLRDEDVVVTAQEVFPQAVPGGRRGCGSRDAWAARGF
eukprot:4481137-Prymnesium_polylepis.1